MIIKSVFNMRKIKITKINFFLSRFIQIEKEIQQLKIRRKYKAPKLYHLTSPLQIQQ